ncbi:hypothetical protein BKH45_01780 [Helicobacter sp. 11S03491-1]|nr:hypothetical protein BKH45_01780 [Helicobacter sp. 11S03491-1]
MLLQGNNLLSLHSLKHVKSIYGQVKLIYIDPPYNTGKDSFNYNDNFNHCTWLTFMKNRLEIAYEFLREDGVIFIQCDDNEQAYLKVLCDEIFGRENFVATICWEKKTSPQNDAKWLSDNHDFILIYARNKKVWRPNLLPRTKEMDARYTNPDNDPRGPWMGGDLSVRTYNLNYDFPITTPSGRIVNPPTGRSWRTSREGFKKLLTDNRIYFGKNGNNVPTIKRFLNEVKNGITSLTVWAAKDVGTNLIAKNEIKALFDNKNSHIEAAEIRNQNFQEVSQENYSNDNIRIHNKVATPLFATPKPEALLKRIIEISTAQGDLVMDFFAGSGTTLAVAHKMHRKWVGIEQMDYIENITKKRLEMVVYGEQGGISKAVGWKSGGEFVYAKLASFNALYKEKIQNSTEQKELENIYEDLEQKAFLDYHIDLQAILKDKEFKDLNLENKKEILRLLLDSNMDYLPYGDIKDAVYGVDKNTIELNEIFYKD